LLLLKKNKKMLYLVHQSDRGGDFYRAEYEELPPMPSEKEFIEYLNQADRFCACNDIRIASAGGGKSVVEMAISERLFNAGGVVHGGAIFTLADFAFAAAANADLAEDQRIVMMSSSITVVRPGTGSKLRAEGTTLSRGSRTGLFEVRVFDDQERLVAVVTTNGFMTRKETSK
jgi:acyl-CoA thioesterase